MGAVAHPRETDHGTHHDHARNVDLDVVVMLLVATVRALAVLIGLCLVGRYTHPGHVWGAVVAGGLAATFLASLARTRHVYRRQDAKPRPVS